MRIHLSTILVFIILRFPLIYGQITFEKIFGGANDDMAFSVQQTSDSGYIIVGCTESYDNSSDIYLIKTDSSGNISWMKTFGKKESGINDFGYSVQQTDDDGCSGSGR